MPTRCSTGTSQQKGEVTELSKLLFDNIFKTIRESGEADFLVQDERFEELERRFR